MLTTCTACSTQFRVTTAQLRAVHGLVRCSRCHSVFDAFETLREEFEAAPAVPQPAENDNDIAELPQPPTANQEEPEISPDTQPTVVDPMDPDVQLHASKASAATEDLFADLWGKLRPLRHRILSRSHRRRRRNRKHPCSSRIVSPSLRRWPGTRRCITRAIAAPGKPAPKFKLRPVRINNGGSAAACCCCC